MMEKLRDVRKQLLTLIDTVDDIMKEVNLKNVSTNTIGHNMIVIEGVKYLDRCDIGSILMEFERFGPCQCDVTDCAIIITYADQRDRDDARNLMDTNVLARYL